MKIYRLIGLLALTFFGCDEEETGGEVKIAPIYHDTVSLDQVIKSAIEGTNLGVDDTVSILANFLVNIPEVTCDGMCLCEPVASTNCSFKSSDLYLHESMVLCGNSYIEIYDDTLKLKVINLLRKEQDGYYGCQFDTKGQKVLLSGTLSYDSTKNYCEQTIHPSASFMLDSASKAALTRLIQCEKKSTE